MKDENAFKNWINPALVKKMAHLFHGAYPAFDEKRFLKNSVNLKDLELKGRVLLLTKGLREELPLTFTEAAKILKKVLLQNELKNFELWPLSEYISQFGLDHFDESMEFMYLLTQQFTSEFAIRPFLKKDPERVLRQFSTWLTDENVHVRRWITEGSRPLLPWGGKIQSFIERPATIHLLDALKYDEELYVRKSIANHLNDISKHHPELVLETLKKWEKSSPKQHRDKINWIIKHALRTLIKQGHIKALGLMGASDKAEVKVSKFKMKKNNFKVGDVLEFQFILESTGKKEHKMIIDYGIGYVKSNGTISTKIYKLKSVKLGPKESMLIKKNHSLKKITTTTFYSGKHELIIQVNGKILKKATWNFEI